MTISIEYIKAQLRRRADERQLTAVATGAKVNLRTLRRIMDGENVGVNTVDEVEVFLRNTERDKKLKVSTDEKAKP